MYKYKYSSDLLRKRQKIRIERLKMALNMYNFFRNKSDAKINIFI